jgi:hypothetical protein
MSRPVFHPVQGGTLSLQRPSPLCLKIRVFQVLARRLLSSAMMEHA